MEFKEVFDKFVIERQADVDDNIVIKDELYVHLSKRIMELTNRIQEALSEEMWKVFLELEEYETRKLCLFEDYMYKQGFKDAMRLIVMGLM